MPKIIKIRIHPTSYTTPHHHPFVITVHYFPSQAMNQQKESPEEVDGGGGEWRTQNRTQYPTDEQTRSRALDHQLRAGAVVPVYNNNNSNDNRISSSSPPPPAYEWQSGQSEKKSVRLKKKSPSWINDPEVKRQRRVVKYKAYAVEGKVKA